MSSPDAHASALLNEKPAPLRYDHASTDPEDVGPKLAALIPACARVLDVGCGTGAVTEIIRNLRNASIVGIEPDGDRMRLAASRGMDVHQGYLTLAFVTQHGPFDCIVFADVIEHLPNPAEIVLIAKAGLKPGGSIVASVPNIAHWFPRTDLLRGKFEYRDCGIMDATHLRWFTRKTLAEFFERLGFRITALSHTVNIGLPDYSRRLPWRWLRPSLRRRVVKRLARSFPGLFGCQHIIRATLPS